jgi:hypothetical protein
LLFTCAKWSDLEAIETMQKVENGQQTQ